MSLQSRLLYLFYNKDSMKFPKHYFQFSKQTLFLKRTAVSLTCSILSKEFYDKPIRIPVRMLQRLMLSKMSNHQSSHSVTVDKLKYFGASNLTHLHEGFQSLIQNLKVKYSVKSGPVVAHKNTQIFFQMTIRKQTVQA